MLRQIRVRMDIEGDEVPFGYESTVGFNILNGTIWFENCTSEQMATGFRFSNQTLVFRGCAATWYSPVGDKEIAFECLSSFRASIVNATVDFREDVANRAFLVSGSSGKGVIVNPIFDESLSDNKAYRNFLTDVG